FQGGIQAADRSAGLFCIDAEVGHRRESQMLVALRRADQRHASGGGANPFSGALHQNRAADGQQRFVAPHAGTAAARQNESRAGLHEKMLTMRQQKNRGPLRSNKKVYICSLVLVMLAASPMRSAEPSATSSL